MNSDTVSNTVDTKPINAAALPIKEEYELAENFSSIKPATVPACNRHANATHYITNLREVLIDTCRKHGFAGKQSETHAEPIDILVSTQANLKTDEIKTDEIAMLPLTSDVTDVKCEFSPTAGDSTEQFIVLLNHVVEKQVFVQVASATLLLELLPAYVRALAEELGKPVDDFEEQLQEVIDSVPIVTSYEFALVSIRVANICNAAILDDIVRAGKSKSAEQYESLHHILIHTGILFKEPLELKRNFEQLSYREKTELAAHFQMSLQHLASNYSNEHLERVSYLCRGGRKELIKSNSIDTLNAIYKTVEATIGDGYNFENPFSLFVDQMRSASPTMEALTANNRCCKRGKLECQEKTGLTMTEFVDTIVRQTDLYGRPRFFNDDDSKTSTPLSMQQTLTLLRDLYRKTIDYLVSICTHFADGVLLLLERSCTIPDGKRIIQNVSNVIADEIKQCQQHSKDESAVFGKFYGLTEIYQILSCMVHPKASGEKLYVLVMHAERRKHVNRLLNDLEYAIHFYRYFSGSPSVHPSAICVECIDVTLPSFHERLLTLSQNLSDAKLTSLKDALRESKQQAQSGTDAAVDSFARLLLDGDFYQYVVPFQTCVEDFLRLVSASTNKVESK